MDRIDPIPQLRPSAIAWAVLLVSPFWAVLGGLVWLVWQVVR